MNTATPDRILPTYLYYSNKSNCFISFLKLHITSQAAEGVKDYYDEHARDTVATYTNQAAEIAKQAAATAKQAGNGAKVITPFSFVSKN